VSSARIICWTKGNIVFNMVGERATQKDANMQNLNPPPPSALIRAGSESDIPKVRELYERLRAAVRASNGAWTFIFNTASAHRSPGLVRKICRGLKKNNVRMILPTGGAAFALAGALSAESKCYPIFSLPLGPEGERAPFVSAACLPPSTPAPSFVTNDIVTAAEFTIQYMGKVVPQLSKDSYFDFIVGENSPVKALDALKGTAKDFEVPYALDWRKDFTDNRISVSIHGMQVFSIVDESEENLQVPGWGSIIGRPGGGKNGGLQAARILAPKNPKISKYLREFAKKNEENAAVANDRVQREYSA
jgi:phosphoribosylcarboxyaminoimidazole (NCAIR) mutase